MPNGLISPGLVLEVVEASKDYVITSEEFSDLIGTINLIVIGAFTIGIIGMFIGSISKRFAEGG